ncbi:MAG: J domain-containing protein [Deltaproteobacteria bacterium]|nr:J domain-containing protein [Deltaproteobacteria bacterium]
MIQTALHPHFYMALFALVTLGVIGILFSFALSRRKSLFKNKAHFLNKPVSLSEQQQEFKKTIDESNPFELLGVSASSNREHILKAYRKKLKLYHPDTVSHKGKNYSEFAKQKTIQLQKAKEELLKKLG